MSKFRTWTIRAGMGLLIAVLAAGATALWMWSSPIREPSPPLVAGLKGGWAEVSVAFDRRVRARFPIGMADQDLGAELQRQGFTRKDWSSSPAAEHLAIFERDELICRESFEVYWRVDATGRLTSVRGDHPAAACV